LFLAYVVSFPLVFFLPIIHGVFAWTKGARLAAITLSMGFNNSKYFWWYLVTIGRIGLTALAVSVIELERQKLAGVLFVLIIGICLQASTNPYDVDEHNNLALMSFIISFIQLYTRYYYFDSKENSLMNTLMGILCGLLWFGMLIYMFYALYIGSSLYDEKLHAAEAKKGELNQKEESSIGDKQSEDEFRDDDETTDNNSIKLTALTTNANASRGEADDMTGNSGRGGRGNGGGSAVPDYIPMAQDVAPKPVKHTIIFHV
jgi:hypothetical protein